MATTFDLQRTLRAIHWHANARTHQAPPQIDQDRLRDARHLQLTADYAGAIACVQADPNWASDPRAWRLIGLCSQALARYEKNPERRKELNQLSERAAATDRQRRVTETAEADVNLASTLIDQNRYAEALEIAIRARATDPRLPTAHIAILAIHNRQNQIGAVIEYLKQQAQHDAWLFEDTIFCDHLATDPDLVGISDHIPSFKRRQS
jgi:tetratricopeptide (TPR) repeat protein